MDGVTPVVGRAVSFSEGGPLTISIDATSLGGSPTVSSCENATDPPTPPTGSSESTSDDAGSSGHHHAPLCVHPQAHSGYGSLNALGGNEQNTRCGTLTQDGEEEQYYGKIGSDGVMRSQFYCLARLLQLLQLVWCAVGFYVLMRGASSAASIGQDLAALACLSVLALSILYALGLLGRLRPRDAYTPGLCVAWFQIVVASVIRIVCDPQRHPEVDHGWQNCALAFATVNALFTICLFGPFCSRPCL